MAAEENIRLQDGKDLPMNKKRSRGIKKINDGSDYINFYNVCTGRYNLKCKTNLRLGK